MLRNVGAVIAGLIVGMVFNMVVLRASFLVFPPPEGMDTTDPAQVAELIKTMPAGAWIFVFVAHLGQAFVGGWIAARLGASRPMLLAMIVGVLSLAGGIANALMIGAPAWTWIEMPLYLAVAWLAGRLEVRRRESASAA